MVSQFPEGRRGRGQGRGQRQHQLVPEQPQQQYQRQPQFAARARGRGRGQRQLQIASTQRELQLQQQMDLFSTRAQAQDQRQLQIAPAPVQAHQQQQLIIHRPREVDERITPNTYYLADVFRTANNLTGMDSNDNMLQYSVGHNEYSFHEVITQAAADIGGTPDMSGNPSTVLMVLASELQAVLDESNTFWEQRNAAHADLKSMIVDRDELLQTREQTLRAKEDAVVEMRREKRAHEEMKAQLQREKNKFEDMMAKRDDAVEEMRRSRWALAQTARELRETRENAR